MKKRKLAMALTLISVFFCTNISYRTNINAKENNNIEKYDDLLNLNVSENIKLSSDYVDDGSDAYVNLQWNSPGVEDNDNSYEYRIFAKNLENSDEHYHSIPAKGTVSVLNITPTDSIGANLAEWMKEPALELAKGGKGEVAYKNPNTGIAYQYNYIRKNGKILTNGMGYLKADSNGKPYKINGKWAHVEGGEERISVTKTTVDEFNSFNKTYVKKDNDTAYINQHKNKNCLVDENGRYKYDVIYEGAYDCNYGKAVNGDSRTRMEDFIKSGKGVLAGHDTIGYDFGSNNNLGPLRKYFNIKVGYWSTKNISIDADHAYQGGMIGDTIKVQKKGLLTNYPWKIGEIGTELTIPLSHTTANYAYGDIWMNYSKNVCKKTCDENNELLYKDGNYRSTFPEEFQKYANFYLTTNNNTAMIQTGHSNGKSTPDEQKLLANTLFYLCQVTTDTKWHDHYCQDEEAPDMPVIKECEAGDTINLAFDSVEDNGSKYSYIVQANNVSNNEQSRSEEKEVEVKSGVKEYLVYTDDKEDTDVEKLIQNSKNKDLDDENLKSLGISIIKADEFNGTCTVDIKETEECYVHLAAMDKAGNVSITNSKKVTDNNVVKISTDSKIKVKKKFKLNIELNITDKLKNRLYEEGVSEIKGINLDVSYSNNNIDCIGGGSYFGFSVVSVNRSIRIDFIDDNGLEFNGEKIGFALYKAINAPGTLLYINKINVEDQNEKKHEIPLLKPIIVDIKIEE